MIPDWLRRAVRRTGAVPLHAWLVSSYPILLIAGLNAGEIELTWILSALGACAATVTCCLFAYRLALGDFHKAGIGCGITAFFFYAYGPVSLSVDAWWLARSDHGALLEAALIAYRTPMVMTGLWLFALIAALYLTTRLTKQVAARCTPPLNAIAAMLCTVAVGQNVASAVHRSELASPSTFDASMPALRESPDIYYIVLDGYARADVLEAHYGYDNGPFLHSLRSQGFTVNERGFANYYWTFLSLASSLNMEYVPTLLQEAFHPDSEDPFAAYEAIRDNAVARTLRTHGYRFIQLQSTWGATLANPYADVMISCGEGPFKNEFFRTIAEASWLRALTAHASSQLAGCHLTNLQTLEILGAVTGPKFVFAHFILPHHPYLFDRHGTVLQDATIANQLDFQARLWEKREPYIEQLIWLNGAIERTVQAIRASSARPPIIILQSDHGPQLVDGLERSERQRVRLANFSAYLLPGAPHDLIPQGDSSVNLFRRILSFYFDESLPIYENRHFYSPFRRPFMFEEVTDLIRNGAPDATSK